MKKNGKLIEKRRFFFLFAILIVSSLILLFFHPLSFAQQNQQQPKNSQTQPTQSSSEDQPRPQSSQKKPQTQQISNNIELANKAVEEGRFEEAIKIYTSILKENPNNFAARVRLARTYYFATNINPDYFYQAIKEYNNVIKIWPDFSLSYLHLGQIAYLLGLKSEAKGKKDHAKGLYQSALAWFNRYINLEQKQKKAEKEKEIIRARILQAVVYWRLEDQDTASKLAIQAVKDYKDISTPELGPSPLYDYFVRSAIDYVNAKLYNQALIYLEGAWLIQPRPQIKSLFQSVAKIADLSISLKEPIKIKISKEAPAKPSSRESIDELNKKLQAISAKLKDLSSLEEKVQVLEKQLTQAINTKEKIDVIEEKLQNLSSLKDEIEILHSKLDDIAKLEKKVESLRLQRDEIEKLNKQISTLQEKVSLISQLNERINALQEKMQVIPEIQKSIKDMETKVQDISKLKTTVQEIKNSLISVSSPDEKIQQLEQALNKLDKKVSNIKSVADRFNILNIQLQELRKIVDELSERLSKLEKEIAGAPKTNKE